MTHQIRVGILEDDPDMRDYLESIIDRADHMRVEFSVPSLKTAIQKMQNGSQTDICLVDLQLPDGNGIDFIREMASTRDNIFFLVLTVLGDRSSVLSALEAGAHGYLLKDSDEISVVKNIRQTVSGANPLSPEAATHLLSLLKKNNEGLDSDPALASALSDREADVLTYLAKGMSYKETAEVLDLSVHTINGHVKIIYEKLRVHSKSEAVFEALKLGWINL